MAALPIDESVARQWAKLRRAAVRRRAAAQRERPVDRGDRPRQRLARRHAGRRLRRAGRAGAASTSSGCGPTSPPKVGKVRILLTGGAAMLTVEVAHDDMGDVMVGESALEQADRQRAETATPSGALWEMSADGEASIGRALDELRASPGWTVLHDVPWPGAHRAYLDHVVIGPSGVFVIDAKTWAGEITVEGEELRANGRSRTDAVRRRGRGRADAGRCTRRGAAPGAGPAGALLRARRMGLRADRRRADLLEPERRRAAQDAPPRPRPRHRRAARRRGDAA